MSQLDSVVFGNKKFSDILEEIYTNQNEKKRQVKNIWKLESKMMNNSLKWLQ